MDLPKKMLDIYYTPVYYLKLFRKVEDSFNSRIQLTRLPQLILNLINSLH